MIRGKNLTDYLEYVELLQNKKLVFWGGGNYDCELMERGGYYKPDEVSYIVDSDKGKWGSEINGVPIYPPDKLLEEYDSVIVLITSKDRYGYHAKNIRRKLFEMHIPHVFTSDILINTYNYNNRHYYDGDESLWFHEKRSYKLVNDNIEKINRIRQKLEDEKSREVWDRWVFNLRYNLNWFYYADISDDTYEHYFSDDIFEWEDEEVFVDGGSFDGADDIWFNWLLERNGKKLKKAYIFEPDPNNFTNVIYNLINETGVDNKIVSITGRESRWNTSKWDVYRAGLYDKNDGAGFVFTETDGVYGSRVVSDQNKNEGSISTVRLDDVVDPSIRITYIKYDLEGADYAAIQGAAETIKRDKPKLALSLYHEIEDLWRIPEFIMNLVPEYKFYVRHHHYTKHEKVLYAHI